jgi:hypothetical protein
MPPDCVTKVIYNSPFAKYAPSLKNPLNRSGQPPLVKLSPRS